MDATLAALADRGIRRTPQRVAVVRALEGRSEAMSASEVLREARAHCPELGLSTVYRTLDALNEVGLLDAIGRHDGEATYRICGGGHHHHLVCSRCRRVVVLPNCDLSAAEAQVAREHGFRVDGHTLSFHGVCADCRI